MGGAGPGPDADRVDRRLSGGVHREDRDDHRGADRSGPEQDQREPLAMDTIVFPPVRLGPLMPTLVVLTAAAIVLVLDIVPRSLPRELPAMVALAGMIGALLATLMRWSSPGRAFRDMVVLDNFALFFNIVICYAGALVVLLSMDYLRRTGTESGEYWALVLFSTAGMMLLAAAGDLVVVFLALELMSLSLYVLAGLFKRELASGEAAMKYFLLGAFASSFLLYGIALIYGAAGTTNLDRIAAAIASRPRERGQLGALLSSDLYLHHGRRLRSDHAVRARTRRGGRGRRLRRAGAAAPGPGRGARSVSALAGRHSSAGRVRREVLRVRRRRARGLFLARGHRRAELRGGRLLLSEDHRLHVHARARGRRHHVRLVVRRRPRAGDRAARDRAARRHAGALRRSRPGRRRAVAPLAGWARRAEPGARRLRPAASRLALRPRRHGLSRRVADPRRRRRDRGPPGSGAARRVSLQHAAPDRGRLRAEAHAPGHPDPGGRRHQLVARAGPPPGGARPGRSGLRHRRAAP